MVTKTAPMRKTRSTKQKSVVKKPSKKKEAAVDLSKSYNEYKNFEGQQYSGMKVGRTTSGITIKASGRKQRLLPTYGRYHMLLPSEEQVKLLKVLVFRLEPNVIGTFLHIKM